MYFSVLVEIKGLLYAVCMGTPENAAIIYEACKAADRVGAAAEPEEKKFITGIVVLNDKTVPVGNVFIYPCPEPSAGDLIMIGAQPPVIEDDLLDSITIKGKDRSCNFQDIGGEISG